MFGEDLIAGTQLPRELRELNQTGRTIPSYYRLWQGMVDGDIPAEQINGRWFIRRDNVPAIAARLGLLASVAA